MRIENDSALEARAQRAARKAGYVATKLRWQRDSVDNLSGFQIIEPQQGFVATESRFELGADEVIEWRAAGLTGAAIIAVLAYARKRHTDSNSAGRLSARCTFRPGILAGRGQVHQEQRVVRAAV